jgi:transketolase
MRCYEQIRVNLALLSEVRSMNVNLIGVGAGYSYVVSGPTHQCYEDITLMRAMPNIQVLSPADHLSAASLFDRCMSKMGPKYLRLDAQVLPVLYHVSPPDLENGFHMHRTGETVCLVATGYMLHTALNVADNLAAMGQSVGVIDLFDISTFSADRFYKILSSFSGIVTLEEGFRGRGGIDSMIFEFIARRDMNLRMLNIGVEGAYRFELGSRTELHEQVGIGPKIVQQKVTSFLQSLTN